MMCVQKIKADMIAAGCSRREDADTQTSWRLSMSMHFETMTNLNSFCYARFILASVSKKGRGAILSVVDLNC